MAATCCLRALSLSRISAGSAPALNSASKLFFSRRMASTAALEGRGEGATTCITPDVAIRVPFACSVALVCSTPAAPATPPPPCTAGGGASRSSTPGGGASTNLTVLSTTTSSAVWPLGADGGLACRMPRVLSPCLGPRTLATRRAARGSPLRFMTEMSLSTPSLVANPDETVPCRALRGALRGVAVGWPRSRDDVTPRAVLGAERRPSG
mmetsp:Transcript_47464/g.111707  ORF Transcript_47464/g.111707 Transcript_47464/m.111707 type:complete len:210 (-) Transcript_47464:91-720(-)|eukprot:CAMPEP_0175845666 /NCGR_PEP_ID=MMETSP0107_2-20121207/22350_1 /TAXON_ID=195067 ORGANISM="Goniomonas pacifica, Strain CCMP1869" /NCGR_SAMPLE_ID=MMETSP0107_2 /ASSEMBLY_ACC=CAM_ASM_000203 /LENGTH=209 /DNA_ID=CAMNT_0017160247 /DNA_START=12 /DNA_END=641 /DNA_ORIENTATION=+